jgi:hypothetical protein
MSSDVLEVAQYAFDSGASSPYITSSPNDMAHRIGLWCRTKRIYPGELHPSRGYTWKLNRNITLTFKESKDPRLMYSMDRNIQIIYKEVG